MSDESPYRPIRITIPDDHPMLNTDGFSDILAEYYASLTLVKPVEPIKLTQEQLDAVRAACEPAPADAPPPLFGTPIIIVERIEDSTPYRRLLEKQRRAAEAAMKIPYTADRLVETMMAHRCEGTADQAEPRSHDYPVGG